MTALNYIHPHVRLKKKKLHILSLCLIGRVNCQTWKRLRKHTTRILLRQAPLRGARSPCVRQKQSLVPCANPNQSNFHSMVCIYRSPVHYKRLQSSGGPNRNHGQLHVRIRKQQLSRAVEPVQPLVLSQRCLWSATCIHVYDPKAKTTCVSLGQTISLRTFDHHVASCARSIFWHVVCMSRQAAAHIGVLKQRCNCTSFRFAWSTATHTDLDAKERFTHYFWQGPVMGVLCQQSKPPGAASSHRPACQILPVLKLYYKVASSQLPALQIAPRTKVVLESRQFSPSSSTDTPRNKSCTTKSPVLSFQLYRLLRVLKLY